MRNEVKKLNRLLLSADLVANFDRVAKGNFGAWLDNLLPEIEQCRQQQQRTPWHLYSVWGHTLHALDAVNQLSADEPPACRLALAYTMLFHDLGKPACHVVKVRDGVERDTFHGHQTASAEIFARARGELGLPQDWADKVAWLVANHDVFMDEQIATPQGVAQLRGQLPAAAQKSATAMLHALALVGTADNLAQNPALTQASLARVRAFDDLVRAGTERGR